MRFERGDLVWRSGDEAMGALAVCTGAIALRGDGILELLGRGEVTGLEAALPAHPRDQDCVAVTAGRGRWLPAPALRTLVRANNDRWAVVVDLMCQRLATSHAWSRARAVGTVRRRLAHVLSMLMGRSGIRDARGVFIPLRLPRSDLADLAGCRVETAVRQLTSWRDAGLLHTVREGLVVTEPEQLIRIAEGP